MDFRIWLEATFDPSLTHLYKTTWRDEKPRFGSTYRLKLDKGQVVPITDEDTNNRTPYFELMPHARQISLQGMSPMSPDFAQFVKALRSKYRDIDNWEVQVWGQAGHMKTGNNKWNRTVGYWTRHEPVNLRDRMPLFFYHGTSSNLWNTGIKQNGLMPRRLSGSSGSYGAQNISALSQPDLVYLSVHPDAGAREASLQAAEKHGGRPLIVRVKGDALFPDRFVPDEDTRSNDPQDSIRRMAVVAYAGRIPASAVQPYLLGRRDDTGSTRQVYWTKYTDVPTEEHPLTKTLKANHLPGERDAAFFALQDAGIIDVKDKVDDNGHRNRQVFKIRDADDEEIRGILKKSGWTQNVLAIFHDINNAYQGALYQLKDRPLPEDLTPEQEKVIKMLLESGLLRVETSGEHKYFNLITWYPDKYAVKLAKLMGKMSFPELAKIVKSIS